jgi:hypothetical protein
MESRKRIQFMSSKGKKIEIALRANMPKVSTMTDLIVNAYRSCVQGARFKQEFFVGDDAEMEKTIFSLLIQAYKLPMANVCQLIGMDESEVYFRINLHNAGKEPFSAEEEETSDDHVPYQKQVYLKMAMVANYVKLYERKHGVLPSNI